MMGSGNDLFGSNSLVTGKILFVIFRLEFWVQTLLTPAWSEQENPELRKNCLSFMAISP